MDEDTEDFDDDLEGFIEAALQKRVAQNNTTNDCFSHQTPRPDSKEPRPDSEAPRQSQCRRKRPRLCLIKPAVIRYPDRVKSHPFRSDLK
jgi:hypothetical protein